LSDAGVDVTLFASGDSDVPCRTVPVIREALRLRSTPVKDPFAFNLKLLAAVADRTNEFDIIHNHHDYWMLPLSRIVNKPLLTTLHGRLDLPDVDEAFLPYPDVHYVSISDSQRRPMPWLRWIKTIHHGLDLSRFKFSPRPGKYLAFLGRIAADKRPDWAIEIAHRAGVPLKIAAKIEGKDMQDYFDTHVKPHLDGRNVEYVGEISDHEKSEFLGNALGLTFPIDWPEPFGLVMIESLACGTPVLARPIGAASEVLKDGVTGYIHLDIQELARRVRDLESIDRAGCRQWVEKGFSLQRMTEDYINVYRQLAGSSAGRAARPAERPFERRRSHRYRRNFVHSVQRVADGNS
jgi:glycosyltransferase involved in cell wall biosynthesis